MKRFIKFMSTALALFLALFVTLNFSSCSDDDPEPPKSSEKVMSDLTISAGGQTFNATLQGDQKTFNFLYPLNLSQDLLKTATPVFKISAGATVSPASGQSQDFTKDVNYTVTAEDGSTAVYTVHKLDGTSSETGFERFSLYIGTPEDLVGTIDDLNSTIYFTRPPEELQENLLEAVPTFTLSLGATASPASGVKQDFTGPVQYVVTAHDGITKRTWTVMQSNRTGAEIERFFLDIYKDAQSTYEWRGDVQMEDPDAVIIDKEARTVTYILPVLPDWFTPSKMTVFPAVIQISAGATVSPNWDVPQDFSKDVVYTITAEDGKTQKAWTVKAAKHYTKEKWYVDYRAYNPAGDQNPNSIALSGNYLNVSRTTYLINKSDGTVAGATLNNSGLLEADGGNFISQSVPFYVTNDEAGNMVGTSLHNAAWNVDAFVIYKWSSATSAPEILLNYPTKVDGVQVTAFGRKVQVLGDINGKGLIIASNMIDGVSGNEGSKDQGEHYIWKINGGVVDTNNPEKVKTNIRWDNSNYGYQLLTPLGLDPVGPWYVGTHASQIGSGDEVVRFYPNLNFGSIGNMDPIPGPFDLGTASANGWGNAYWLYQKVFTYDGMNMIATFTGSFANYCFALLERKSDNSHVPITTTDIEQDSNVTPNGNGTGGFTMEKVGNDVFFYVFPTNNAVACYQLSKF